MIGAAKRKRRAGMLRRAALLAACLLIVVDIGAKAERPQENPRVRVICSIVDNAAVANRLPPAFLARVLWQESRFRNEATSPAGAEGVAQFMRQTAAERGLADPRDPALAITAAARLLAELTARFGNVGLAAAAYNAGGNRIVQWLHSAASLPAETRLYVNAVTGRVIDDWVAPSANRLVIGGMSCLETIVAMAAREPIAAGSARLPPAAWQIRLDRSLARLAGSLVVQEAQPPETTDAAKALCRQLRSRGANCMIYAR